MNHTRRDEGAFSAGQTARTMLVAYVAFVINYYSRFAKSGECPLNARVGLTSPPVILNL